MAPVVRQQRVGFVGHPGGGACGQVLAHRGPRQAVDLRAGGRLLDVRYAQRSASNLHTFSFVVRVGFVDANVT